MKQLQPAVWGYCLDVPTGVTDDREGPEAAVPWELKEETGYKSDVAERSPAIFMDPVLFKLCAHIETITITGDDAENIRPKPKPGDGDFVK